MAQRQDALAEDAQWRTAGDRIQSLLDAFTGGAAARQRAEQLVGEVVELYGAGLARIVDLAGETPDAAVLDRMVADELVASLLLVHGLHPHDVYRRVSDALDGVRPYLGSHGGDVQLLNIAGDTVQLEFAGSCKGCPSSAVTLELTVEDAIRAAAPEISSIEVVAAEPEPATPVIPAEALLTKVHADHRGSTAWHRVPEVAELASGEVGGFGVDDAVVLACRVGEHLYAYRDHCPACEDSLAGATLHRGVSAEPGDPPADAKVLRCPRCRADFDVVHAGASLEHGPGCHLDPIPLLVRDGVLSIAMPADTMGAPA
jgi:Fe-S cluster biogenesis protein NfuA/nitrite reductase/ring-hydroxylating ferredoxin subunit